jgi:hypothetical protein
MTSLVLGLNTRVLSTACECTLRMGNEFVVPRQFVLCCLYPRRSSLMALVFGVLGLVISTNYGQQEKSITALIEVY